MLCSCCAVCRFVETSIYVLLMMIRNKNGISWIMGVSFYGSIQLNYSHQQTTKCIRWCDSHHHHLLLSSSFFLVNNHACLFGFSIVFVVLIAYYAYFILFMMVYLLPISLHLGPGVCFYCCLWGRFVCQFAFFLWLKLLCILHTFYDGVLAAHIVALGFWCLFLLLFVR